MRMHQGPVLSPFLLAVVGDITVLAKEFALSELMYAGDIVLMSKTIESLRIKYLNGRRLLRVRIRKLALEKLR